jgi:hypothetical protein
MSKVKNYKALLVEIVNIIITLILWIYVLPKLLVPDSVYLFKFLQNVLLGGSGSSIEKKRFFSILLYIIYFLWMIVIFYIMTKKVIWTNENEYIKSNEK